MSQIIGWQGLTCNCGRDEFTQLFKLQYHLKLGMTNTPIGFQCIHCKRKLDTGQAMKRLQRDYLEKEIGELQDEIKQGGL